jgi:hypothetical protein
MKKRVRIYKSPTGEGQFLNKTAQFLRKAQMGGAPTAEELSYPGATQGQTQQVDDNQLASLVLQDISNSRPKEEIVVKLVNMYGKDPMEATTLVNQMYTYLEEQSEAQKEEDSEESSDEEITGGDPEDAQEETVMNPVQEIEEDFYGDDMNNDMANQVANEDDEVEDDDTDVASQVVMMRGGYMRAQDGAEIESEYPIVFPGVEAYLPANMSDMMGGSYDVATGEAWQRPEFTAPETSDDAGISYGYMDQGAEEAMVEDAPEGIPTEESEYRKGGAYKKGKSAYVNSVLKLVKKQIGGDQENNNPNDLTKKEDQSDPIGNDLRRGILSNYIGTLKNQGQMAVAKEEAEQQYDQMMQQQQMMQQGMPQAPMNYSENGEMLDEAQFGGLFNRRRNQEGQERRGLFNRKPRIPQGFGYGYPPIESVDVYKRGIFGRPKEYSVNFGQMPSVMPGYGMQGSGPGFYGYGYTGTKKTPARKIVEDNAIYVNSQANKDVAVVTPGNEATNKDVKVEEKVEVKADGTTETVATTEVKTPGTETPVTVNSSKTAKEKQVTKDQVKGQKEVNVQKRADGIYTYPNKTAIYKKQNNQWYIDITGVGNAFQKVSSGDVEGRVNALEKNAVTYVQPKAKVVPIPIGNRPDLMKDATGVASQVRQVAVPTYDFKKPKPKVNAFDMDKIMAPIKDPFMFPRQTVIDPKGSQLFGLQDGGIIQDPFSDEYGNLQRFVYGGDDDLSLANMDQSDIDYTGSEDVTDPYFQKGGLLKNLFPANLNRNYSTEYRGARNAAGEVVPGYFGKNSQLKSVDVQKTGLLSGRPKKYSVTFSNQSSDPTKPMISLDRPGTESVIPKKAPMALSQREMDRGDRQAGRQRPLTAGKKYEKYFEEPVLNEEEQAKAFDNQLKYQANVDAYHKERSDNTAMINKMFNQKGEQPGITQNQMQEFQQMIGNQTGIPSYAESPYPTQVMRPEGEFPEGYVQRNPMYGAASDSYESYLDFINSGMPLGQGMTRNEMTREQYMGEYGHYNDGGALRKFIPTAQYGGDSPVVYTNNPAMDGMTDVDMLSLNPGIQDLDQSSLTSFMNVDSPTRDQSQDPKQYTVDPNQASRQQTEKVYEPEGDVTYDFKTKTNVDPQAALLTGNAAAKGVLGFVDRMQNKKNEAKMYKNLTSDNLYASDPSRDRGDYESNSGLYRPDDMGETWNSRSAQMGGQNSYLNEDPDYVEGDEVDMTDEELANFIANGGEVEYL